MILQKICIVLTFSYGHLLVNILQMWHDDRHHWTLAWFQLWWPWPLVKAPLLQESRHLVLIQFWYYLVSCWSIWMYWNSKILFSLTELLFKDYLTLVISWGEKRMPERLASLRMFLNWFLSEFFFVFGDRYRWSWLFLIIFNDLDIHLWYGEARGYGMVY